MLGELVTVTSNNICQCHILRAAPGNRVISDIYARFLVSGFSAGNWTPIKFPARTITIDKTYILNSISVK